MSAIEERILVALDVLGCLRLTGSRLINDPLGRPAEALGCGSQCPCSLVRFIQSCVDLGQGVQHLAMAIVGCDRLRLWGVLGA